MNKIFKLNKIFLFKKKEKHGSFIFFNKFTPRLINCLLVFILALIVTAVFFILKYSDLSSIYFFDGILYISIFIFLVLIYIIYFLVKKISISFERAEHTIRVLKKSRDRYALVVSSTDDGIWDLNIKTGEIIFSSGWKSLIGYYENDEIGINKFWNEIIHPDDVKHVKSAIKYHIDKHTKYYTAEYRIKTKSGLYKWVADRGKVSFDEKNGSQHLLVSARNITNRKNAEIALKSRTEELRIANKKIQEEISNTKKFKQAVHSSTDSVLIVSPEGLIEYVNPSFELLTEYSFDDLYKKMFINIYKDKTPERVLRNVQNAFTEGRSFRTEDMVVLKKNGSTYTEEFSMYPIKEDLQITHFVILGQDITKRKEIDKAKTEFVSLASHQLRTPLSAIRWYAEILMRDVAGSLNAKQEKYVKEIYDANIRMIDLVGTLLNVSRLDLGKFPIKKQITDIIKVAKSVLKDITPLYIKKNIRLIKEFDENIKPVYTDPKIIHMILQNLISNAVKYTQEKGEIRVSLKNRDNNILIEVSDNGFGIPEVEQKKIFSKFFRAENAKETDSSGTGLGLYIVKAVIEKIGGSISFESREGEGTTFYAIIPICVSEEHDKYNN